MSLGKIAEATRSLIYLHTSFFDFAGILVILLFSLRWRLFDFE